MMDMRNSLRRASVAALVLAVSGAMACGEKKEAEKLPLGAAPAAGEATPAAGAAATKPEAVLTPESQKALNTGNEAFRKQDYAGALAQYEIAAKSSPDHAAPWFGIYMVAKAKNDTKGADAALAEIKKRNEAPPMDHMVPDTNAMKKAHTKAGVPATKG
jgi:hypothetical protein